MFSILRESISSFLLYLTITINKLKISQNLENIEMI